MALTAQSTSRIRIFVSAHKPASFPHARTVVPIHVGAANSPSRLPDIQHDDIGDNISPENPMYCELTAQYWAWKNVDADYYGFCHYRRYFDFTGTKHAENDYGEIIDTFIDDTTIARYGIDDTTIKASVEGWDIIVSPRNDVRRMGGFCNLKQHWASDPYLRLQDLRLMYDRLCAKHPDYQEDANAVLDGRHASFCNMFVMRKDIFNEYCSWLFPLLEDFVTRWEHSDVATQTLRTPGHLAERLLNVFIAHKQRTGARWKIKELQCVHFTDPEPAQTVEPLMQDQGQTVPVVLAADENYVPMLATTISSLLHNASGRRHYDVVVLESNISAQNKADLSTFVKGFGNASLRFHNVSRIVSGYHLSTNNAHISIETYYRFIIQEALPHYGKIVYLDCDLIVNGDISQLYDTELGGTAIGAVKDIDFLANTNMKDGRRAAYARIQLHMQDPYQYFQAGVLIMNLHRMRQLHTVSEWLEIAQKPGFIYNDQDILNMECEGEVTYLPPAWNVMHDCAGRVNGVFQHAPAPIFTSYRIARQKPLIVHYAGFDKPWNNPWCDFGTLYWSYAKDTPFAPHMIATLAGVQNLTRTQHHDRVLAEDSPIRKYADIIAPTGSKQREIAKVVMRKIRRKR